ncbi:TetR/AcrR family transcriptional regulator [Ectobacillus sp. JY-23]|uniref:TetR/AcrR family transcriptional regulator n=1 Tax=Ectobacillus sp. JY-23 TaxID=2933872 RepID=UPI001FF2002F|nr:TetR/AcrR family transcriptional regulator [Ectobacillus sp. JY-23]UOY92296.1 TetR/AcrR family transcriptional regulator [Ectobacillus sp. JY-23]
MTKGQVENKRQIQAKITRQKILDAAKDVFLQEGFQKATISQIIKKANTGYGTAYVHFKGKEELLIVLMEDVMAQFYNIAETSFFPHSKAEAKQIISKQVYDFLTLAQAERGMLQIVEQAIGVSAIISDTWKSIREKFIMRIAQDVAYAQKQGLARPELHHELVARGWFFTNEMYLWEIVRNEQQSSIEEIAKTIVTMYTEGLYLTAH